jgi:hypothetical protein
MSVRAEPTSVRAEPVEALTTLTLHDESRQPLAELNAQGRITRQYVWLADMPLAVIDTPASLAGEASGIEQIFKDMATAARSWFEDLEGIAWLHTNHLGAPEAATNAQGHVIWRARYTPFGAAHIESLPLEANPVRPEPTPVRPEPNPVRPEPVEGLTQQERLIAEDRQVRGAVSGNTQRTMGFDNNSLTTAGTYEFITYNPRTVGSYAGVDSNITGTVDMRRYMQWLRNHGYCFSDDPCDDLPTQ